jgi:hypothetical protein
MIASITEHDLLGELLGFRLDHQHGVGRAGDDEIELRFLDLVDQRVELVGAVEIADAGCADRAGERHARQRQGGGGGDHGDDVGVVLEVVLQHRADDLRLVPVALDEERADRPVDQARDQRLLLGRAAFALEIAAGNAAGGEGLLLVVHREREEVDPGLGRLGGDDGREHDGLAIGREHRGVGLAGDLAGFEHELAPAPHQFFGLDIEHGFFFRIGFRPVRGLLAHRQDDEALGVLVVSAPERSAILPWAQRTPGGSCGEAAPCGPRADIGRRRPIAARFRTWSWLGSCACFLQNRPERGRTGRESRVDQRRMPSFSIRVL